MSTSVTINCNDFGDTMKEIIGLMMPEKKSAIIGMLKLFSELSICTNIDNLDDVFSENSDEYRKEIKRLVEECKDSICEGKDKKMTITCDTIRIFLEEDKEDGYEKMKKECQQIRKQIDDNKDIVDIVSSLITKELFVTFSDENKIISIMNTNLPDIKEDGVQGSGVQGSGVQGSGVQDDKISKLIDETGINNLDKYEILKRLKDIPKEKFNPIKQLIGLMMKCTCQIDVDKKGGLSTTVIIIIVVSILLLLGIITYFFLK